MNENDAQKEKSNSAAKASAGLNTVQNTLANPADEYRCAIDGRWHKGQGQVAERWGAQITVCARCKGVVEAANRQLAEVMPVPGSDVLNEAK